MVFDAQYSFEEQLEKLDWGHSSANIGIDIGLKKNTKIFYSSRPISTPKQNQTIRKTSFRLVSISVKFKKTR